MKEISFRDLVNKSFDILPGVPDRSKLQDTAPQIIISDGFTRVSDLQVFTLNPAPS